MTGQPSPYGDHRPTELEAERAAHAATRQRLAELRRIVVDYMASCYSSDAAVTRAVIPGSGLSSAPRTSTVNPSSADTPSTFTNIRRAFPNTISREITVVSFHRIFPGIRPRYPNRSRGIFAIPISPCGYFSHFRVI